MSNLSETPNHAFDPAVAETFAEGVASAINTGAVAVMLSVGQACSMCSQECQPPQARR
jgi:hypothetical protein